MFAQKDERRRMRRVPLALRGHYRVESGADYACETENVSATGALVRGAGGADAGEWVIAYLDDLGRVEGVIVRSAEDRFALEIAATPATARKLAVQLERLSQAEPSEASPRL
jgi:PilZ domain